MKRILITIFLVGGVLSSYSQNRLFVDPDFSQIGNDHKIIAIVPFKTTITLRPKQLEKLEAGQLERMQKDESLNIQLAMYSWFLKRRQQGKMWVDIMDANKTNITLSRKGINYSNIEDYTPEELASILEVDAVIKGTFETNKPMSEGAGLALALLVGFYGTTNQATINMFIHNAEDGKVLVNYHKLVSGSLGSTSDQLINIIMRKASRRIPYTKSKD